MAKAASVRPHRAVPTAVVLGNEREGVSEEAKAGAYTRSLQSSTNLRTFGNTSLTLELNLSTLGKYPRVNWGYMGDKVTLS